MAACGGMRSLFENPLPENPTLIESLPSWNHHKPMKPIDDVSSFAEIFGELYFQEKPESPATIAPVPTPPPLAPPALGQAPQSHISEFDPNNVRPCQNPPLDSPSGLPKDHKNSESLQFCTEGLGTESSVDVDGLMDSGDDRRTCGKGKGETNGYSKSFWDVKSSKVEREFPPPISSIGKSGKPCVCLKSYREDGRFVLREMKIPTQELLRASREDGRLKLHFVHPDEDVAEGGGGENDDDGEQEMTEEQQQEERKVGEGENHQ